MSDEMREAQVPHVADCDGDGCYCPDDVFWARMLGDDDPCAPGKDWAAAAFGDYGASAGCEYPGCTNEAKYASEGGLFCAVPHAYIERADR